MEDGSKIRLEPTELTRKKTLVSFRHLIRSISIDSRSFDRFSLHIKIFIDFSLITINLIVKIFYCSFQFRAHILLFFQEKSHQLTRKEKFGSSRRKIKIATEHCIHVNKKKIK